MERERISMQHARERLELQVCEKRQRRKLPHVREESLFTASEQFYEVLKLYKARSQLA